MNEEFEDIYNKDNENAEGADNSPSDEGSSVEYGPKINFDLPPRSPKNGNGKWAAVMLAVAIVFSLFCGVGGILIGKNLTPSGTNEPPSSSNGGTNNSSDKNNTVIMQETDASATMLDGSVTAVVEKCAASVVEIITTPYSSVLGTVSGAGSGVIVGEDEDGTGSYIVTNNHVVEGNFSVITVRTNDGKEYAAEVVGMDWMSDIAVLRIEKSGLTKAIWADSGALKLGQSIIAIGNPLGSLGGSVSRGIISGVERTITVEGVPMNLLQIDAAINPGNSGGGLFDLNGNLVGIVNAKSVATDVEGIGFAIPANYARDMVNELATKGYISGRIDLGLSFTGSATRYGLTVNEYRPTGGSSTEIAMGDILYSLETTSGAVTQISSIEKYRSVLAGLKAGDTVKAVVLRSVGFSYRQYDVTLTAFELNG